MRVGPAPAGHHECDETAAAFDGVAAGYHDSNATNPILAGMRRRVLAVAAVKATNVVIEVPGE